MSSLLLSDLGREHEGPNLLPPGAFTCHTCHCQLPAPPVFLPILCVPFSSPTALRFKEASLFPQSGRITLPSHRLLLLGLAFFTALVILYPYHSALWSSGKAALLFSVCSLARSPVTVDSGWCLLRMNESQPSLLHHPLRSPRCGTRDWRLGETYLRGRLF